MTQEARGSSLMILARLLQLCISSLLIGVGKAEEPINTPQGMIDKVVASYRADGIAAGISELKNSFAKLSTEGVGGYEFNLHFHKVYKEGQVYSGKADPEWGVALYGWAYENVDGYRSGFQKLDFLPNYCWLLRRCGYRARIRELQTYWQNRFAESGFLTDIDLTDSSESALDGFPDTRRVRYPEAEHLNLNRSRFVTSMADQQRVDGKWKLALSHYMSIEKITKGIWLNRSHTRDSEIEWMNEVATARMGAASVLELLEFYELADEMRHRNVNDRAGIAYRNRPRTIASVWKEFHKLSNHEIDHEILQRIDGLLDRIPKNMYHLPRSLVMARQLRVIALFELSRVTEAWAELDRLVLDYPENDRVINYWISVMIHHGRIEGVEKALLERLKLVRKRGEKIGEIELYFLYARFLEVSNRWNDAVKIRLERIRLLRAFDIYTKLPTAYLELAGIYLKLGNLKAANSSLLKSKQLLGNGRLYPGHVRAKAEKYFETLAKNEKASESASNIELQPRESVSVSVAGLSAKGLVVLRNRGTEDADGLVEFTGVSGKVEGPDEDQVYRLVAGSNWESEQDRSFRISVAAGESIFFDLTASMDSKDEGTCQMLWKPDHGVEKKASWSYRHGTDVEENRAVIDAGVYERNAFHGIMVYHCFQSRNGFQEATDLRIVASQPARIELYDEEGQLMLIDGNGNGRLDDQGDVLDCDTNKNGIADFLSENNPVLSLRFVMMVYPEKELKEGSLELTLSCLDEVGKLIETSKDRIVADPRASGEK